MMAKHLAIVAVLALSLAAGALAGGNDPCDRVTCPRASNQCMEDSICLYGTCLPQEPKAFGTPCDDGDVYTTNDICSNGYCKGLKYECPRDIEIRPSGDNVRRDGETSRVDWKDPYVSYHDVQFNWDVSHRSGDNFPIGDNVVTAIGRSYGLNREIAINCTFHVKIFRERDPCARVVCKETNVCQVAKNCEIVGIEGRCPQPDWVPTGQYPRDSMYRWHNWQPPARERFAERFRQLDFVHCHAGESWCEGKLKLLPKRPFGPPPLFPKLRELNIKSIIETTKPVPHTSALPSTTYTTRATTTRGTTTARGTTTHYVTRLTVRTSTTTTTARVTTTTRATTTAARPTTTSTVATTTRRESVSYRQEELQIQNCENKRSSETKSDCYCSDNCGSCDWSIARKSGACNKCVNGKYLHNGECVDSCPRGFEANGKGDSGRTCRNSRRSASDASTGFNEAEVHGNGSNMGLYLVIAFTVCAVVAVSGFVGVKIKQRRQAARARNDEPVEVVVGDS